MTFHTGDISKAGTDSKLSMKVFGDGGSTSEIPLDKISEHFERGRMNRLKVSERLFSQL